VPILGRQSNGQTSSTTSSMTAPGEHGRLVFSYGANMSSRTLAKRGVAPRRQVPARLVDETYRFISFEHRAAYATLITTRRWLGNAELQCERPFGVVLEIGLDDFERLKEREVGYRVRPVMVQLLDTTLDSSDILDGLEHADGLVVVDAFVSAPGMDLMDGPLPPTHRYRELLRDGLEEHGVARFEGGGGYVRWVRDLPSVDTARDAAYGATFVEMSARIGLVVVIGILAIGWLN
jgi:hypothetical protein